MKKIRRDLLPFVLFLSSVTIMIMYAIRVFLTPHISPVQHEYKQAANYFENKKSSMRLFLEKQISSAKLSKNLKNNNYEDEPILTDPLPSDDPDYISRHLPVWQSNIEIFSDYHNHHTIESAEHTTPSLLEIKDSSHSYTTVPYLHNAESHKPLLPMGTIIDCVLKNSVFSDIPSIVFAQVSTDVYSYDREKVIIPHGTILAGEYNSHIQVGQKRMMIIFHQAMLPNGQRYPIGPLLANEVDGSAGVIAQVDTHIFDRFSHAMLSGSISYALANLPSLPGQSATDPSYQEIAHALSQNSSPTVNTLKTIQPTLFIAAGTAIQLIVPYTLAE